MGMLRGPGLGSEGAARRGAVTGSEGGGGVKGGRRVARGE